jgi:hypothetical protein
MKVTLTNHGKWDIPISSVNAEGWVAELPTDVPYSISNDSIHHVYIGEHPGFEESISHSRALLEAFQQFREHWKSKHRKRKKQQTEPGLLVLIVNDGEQPLYVTLAERKNDFEIRPGDRLDVESAEYIEVRDFEQD